jgi:flavorubredoxin
MKLADGAELICTEKGKEGLLGGGGVRTVNEKLKSAGYEPIESLEVNFKPDEQDLVKCYALGQKIASLVKV